MSEARWQRIEAIFHQAADLSPGARSAFLSEACAGDDSLRKEVESLLHHESEDGSTFVGPAGDAAPQSIAHYRITAKRGEGGMGAVYRATDTKLGREVAIKVLSDEFAADRDRMGRFTREAKVLASLNHPNIAAIYGVEDRALIMELVDGKDLRGPVPIATALNYARQIAAALDAAHEKSVVHRDLKPANIRVTPDGVVKVLDFGLAKQAEPAVASDSATLTSDGTRAGVIMGTPAYMSPEQARGQTVDRRADIWAFGAILYELLTGKMLFGDGRNVSDSLAAILTREPDYTALPADTPPRVRRLIAHCLRKDPKERLRDIGDARILLDEPELSVTASPRRRWLPWAASVGALAAGLVFGSFFFRPKPVPVAPVRFEQSLPSRRLWWDVVPAVSPDGRSFAYNGVTGGTQPMLWVRRLDALQPMVLPGTEDAERPFWSPDSRSIAFLARGTLKKIDLNGGPPQVLCELASLNGATWSQNGIIVFGSGRGPLQQVSASGGPPKGLLRLDADRKEISQDWPSFLPDGRHFLYASYSSDPAKSGTYVGSLDGQEPRRLMDIASNATFVSPGLLIFGRGRVLMAQQFDSGRLLLTGEPFSVADHVIRNNATLISVYSSSPNGVLVYQTDDSASTSHQPVWYGRDGKRLALAGPPRGYIQGVLSPDEKQFAAHIVDIVMGSSDIWLLDLASGILSRITSGSGDKNTPVWSPDGREILFGFSTTTEVDVRRMTIGGGAQQLVRRSTRPVYPGAWLKDGSMLLLEDFGQSFFRITPGTGAEPETLLKTEYAKDGPRVSPDGRWIAYNTDESGRWEVYVAAYPSFTGRRQVSNNGGVQGYWRKDGKELFYLALDGSMVSVGIKTGPPLETGIPEVLFPTRVRVQPQWDQFAVTGDGQRFLTLDTIETDARPFTVVLNWPAAVAQPAGRR